MGRGRHGLEWSAFLCHLFFAAVASLIRNGHAVKLAQARCELASFVARLDRRTSNPQRKGFALVVTNCAVNATKYGAFYSRWQERGPVVDPGKLIFGWQERGGRLAPPRCGPAVTSADGVLEQLGAEGTASMRRKACYTLEVRLSATTGKTR
jgi:hypothetical protein